MEKLHAVTRVYNFKVDVFEGQIPSFKEPETMTKGLSMNICSFVSGFFNWAKRFNCFSWETAI